MAYILSLETSTQVSSVALHRQGELVGAHQLHIDKSHSGLLTVMIDELTQQCQVSLEELAAVAVSIGPGSYTGLRIGLSTAKGLCYGLNIPLITCNTLNILTETVLPYAEAGSQLCPMLDARRMEVYTQLTTTEGKEVLPMQALVLNESSFNKELERAKTYFFGSGSAKWQALLRNHSEAIFVPKVVPLASAMGNLAYRNFENQTFANLAYTEPTYLKDFGGRPLAN